MVRVLSICLILGGCLHGVFAQTSDYDAVVYSYIQAYKDIAVNEMKVYRIPASITLAQGILESNAGRSDLAVMANNHFGIKCHKEWSGMTFYKDDDTKHECFRKYESPLESFRDHSWFLTQRDRYKGLFDLDITDYKSWATGLKSAGYATNPAYAPQLIKTIEKYRLYRFDVADLAHAPGDGVNKPEKFDSLNWVQRLVVIGSCAGNRTIYENNRLKMIISRDDDNIYLVARDVGISVGKLIKYNDLPRATAFKPGQILYLEKKKRKGAIDDHTLTNGESIYSVSQLFGVKLKSIMRRNNLREGVEPVAGTVLRLR